MLISDMFSFVLRPRVTCYLISSSPLLDGEDGAKDGWTDRRSSRGTQDHRNSYFHASRRTPCESGEEETESRWPHDLMAALAVDNVLDVHYMRIVGVSK